jgi:hypothetical protein
MLMAGITVLEYCENVSIAQRGARLVLRWHDGKGWKHKSLFHSDMELARSQAWKLNEDLVRAAKIERETEIGRIRLKDAF